MGSGPNLIMKSAALLLCLLLTVSGQRLRPFAGGKTPKLCSDNSNPKCGDNKPPVCKDGTKVRTTRFPPCPGQGPPTCQDGSRLRCEDGSELKRPRICNDGSRPSCPGGVAPVCPGNIPLDLTSLPPCQEGRPRYNTAQAQYSVVQYNTIQYSTVQCSSVSIP